MNSKLLVALQLRRRVGWSIPVVTDMSYICCCILHTAYVVIYFGRVQNHIQSRNYFITDERIHISMDYGLHYALRIEYHKNQLNIQS
jgi:hypothetical protein